MDILNFHKELIDNYKTYIQSFLNIMDPSILKFVDEMEWVKDETKLRVQTDEVALERANHLVLMHTKVRNLLGGFKYKVVEPVLPMDVLGLCILLPEIA